MHTLTADRADEWERFVSLAPGSKIEHTLQWRDTIASTYSNCVPLYLYAESERTMLAVLPCFRVHSPLFGQRILSQPFMDAGGILGNASRPVIDAFADFLRLQSRGARFAEIRLSEWMPNFPHQTESWRAAGARVGKERQQVILALSHADKVWEEADKHARNDVRKAQKSGLTLREMELGRELDSFYVLYRRTMHGFGTPHHSREYFTNLFAKVPSACIRGWNAYAGDRLAASLMLLVCNRYAFVAFNVSEPFLRDVRPNDLLYWTAIEWACSMGCAFIDFGQADTSAPAGSHARGLLEFKLKWGGKIYQRPSYYLPLAGDAPSSDGGARNARKFTRLWAAMPSFITDAIGPTLCAQWG